MPELRERLLDAMLDLVSTQGYEETSIEQIVDAARVNRAEFDRLFATKEECAIAVFDRALVVYDREVHDAFDSEPEWPASLRAAAYAAARWITANAREARFGIVALLWVGELAQVRREAAFQNFAAMVDVGRERAQDPEQVPEYTAEGVIGSIAEMITKRMQHGEVSAYEFVPELMYLAVLPYLGEEVAARELTMPRPRRDSGQR
jgi:AcrR family transcriptional regulator